MRGRFIIGMAVLLAMQCQVASSNAAETMARFKPDRQIQGRLLRSTVPPSKRSNQGEVPLTRETVSAAVDARIKVLFDRAADPATQLVTFASAEKAGVGYFTGHFADIDRDRDGSLTFGEVKGFLDAQSPIAKPSAEGSVQIIE
ncbi:hypothetical protein [Phyllobacterium chamaecytisi]|uniref:hypothetical protein n=1 Tax=Phyllobacterium chamaecytisi TaxID=2876082 RepID=UPI001CCFE4F1|nr:hypothetical protein [Phyllobacterium sp. KW56]MBZ9602466.1 hypothetical protein [Phyllobacterium sp. KW56]